MGAVIFFSKEQTSCVDIEPFPGQELRNRLQHKEESMCLLSISPIVSASRCKCCSDYCTKLGYLALQAGRHRSRGKLCRVSFTVDVQDLKDPNHIFDGEIPLCHTPILHFLPYPLHTEEANI